ncbi:MAG: CPBP family intramembrane glutamic endopeptidase [Marmoricola sp.]
MVAHPHSEPRSYPLMLRTWDYAWWKPLVGFLLLLVGGFIAVPVVLIPVLGVAVALEGGSGTFEEQFREALTLDSVTPASMLYLNLSLAALTLVTMGIVRWVHRLRPRWLSSVMPGMRWRFFFACLGLSVVALVASVLIGLLLPQDPNALGGEPNKLTGTLVATGIVILLTTPLQALGEEYAFRGYLMQAFGSFTHGIAEASGASARVARGIAIGIALTLTSGLFALAHGTQNFPLFFDRFAFGLMAGLVVVLVGGLEAGIALHILNNLVAFGIAIAFGDLQGALTVSEVSWWQLPVTVVQNGIYLVLVLLVARRMGLRNTTSPPLAGAAPQQVG